MQARPLAISIILLGVTLSSACAPASGVGSQVAGLEAQVAAQATQIAVQQEQIAALQAAVAQPRPQTAATTPTIAARLFVEALIVGDPAAAITRMRVAEQSTWSGAVQGHSQALAPCRANRSEFTLTTERFATTSVRAQFSPPCGSLVEAATVMNSAAGSSVTAADRRKWEGKPITQCTVGVATVDDQWKVVALLHGPLVCG